MKKIAVLLLLIFTISIAITAQNSSEQTISCFTTNMHLFSFKLTPPNDWKLDQNNADKTALAMIYPEKCTWASAVTAMSINYQTYGPDEANLEIRIIADIKDAKISQPNAKIEIKPDIIINKNLKAKIVYYMGTNIGDTRTFYFADAYIPDKNGTIFIILNSYNLEDFYKSIPLFEQVVKSYKFIESSK